MSPTIWFTSDTHFGHNNLLAHRIIPMGLLRQPGPVDILTHDEELVRRWNERVKRHDVVYHIGDFAWVTPAKYLARLNGHIHLVKGNHDRLNAATKGLFTSYTEGIKKVKVGGQKIYLLHYAMRVWNCSHYGSWHLYGHSHGNLSDDPHAHSLDVGMDVRGFAPISYDEVATLMALKDWRAVDHHDKPRREDLQPTA